MIKRKRKEFAGLTLLGTSEAEVPKSPRQAKVETFPNPKPGRDYTIHVNCPGFTSLCPVTNQPDFAEINLEYTPGALCLETKSLKLYLASYRNEHAFNETVINRILDDLAAACNPRRMRVEGHFAARGGLALTVTAEFSQAQVGAATSRQISNGGNA